MNRHAFDESNVSTLYVYNSGQEKINSGNVQNNKDPLNMMIIYTPSQTENATKKKMFWRNSPIHLLTLHKIAAGPSDIKIKFFQKSICEDMEDIILLDILWINSWNLFFNATSVLEYKMKYFLRPTLRLTDTLYELRISSLSFNHSTFDKKDRRMIAFSHCLQYCTQLKKIWMDSVELFPYLTLVPSHQLSLEVLEFENSLFNWNKENLFAAFMLSRSIMNMKSLKRLVLEPINPVWEFSLTTWWRSILRLNCLQMFRFESKPRKNPMVVPKEQTLFLEDVLKLITS